MRIVALVLSVAVAVLGGIGIVVPTALLSVAEHFLTPNGLWVAAALRILLGAALLFVASGSRFPRALRAIGVLILFAGLATPLIGVERARAIVEWETAHGRVAIRIPAAVALAMGLFLAYATAPRRDPLG